MRSLVARFDCLCAHSNCDNNNNKKLHSIRLQLCPNSFIYIIYLYAIDETIATINTTHWSLSSKEMRWAERKASTTKQY